MKTLVLATTVAILMSAASAAVAEDYAASWGPKLGAALPVLSAPDQSGAQQTFETLRGKRGLLISLNRSAEW